jgi:hypothetical protein
MFFLGQPLDVQKGSKGKELKFEKFEKFEKIVRKN